MFEEVYNFFNYFLGLSDVELTFFHMTFRSLIIYLLGIVIIKYQRRFMQLRTVFNFFLYVLLGSMLASAIIGNSPYIDTVLAVIIIMSVNTLVTISVFYFPAWERLIKGKPAILVKDGEIQWQAMRKYYITKDELLAAVHAAWTKDLADVKEAIFENNGDIRIIRYQDK